MRMVSSEREIPEFATVEFFLAFELKRMDTYELRSGASGRCYENKTLFPFLHFTRGGKSYEVYGWQVGFASSG